MQGRLGTLCTMYCIKKKKKLPSVTLAVLIKRRRRLRSVSRVGVDPTTPPGVIAGDGGGYVDGSCVMCEPPRPNLRVYLRVFCLSFGFFILLCLGTVSPFPAKSSWCFKL